MKPLFVAFASIALAIAANLGIASAHPSREPSPTPTPTPNAANTAAPAVAPATEVDVEQTGDNETQDEKTSYAVLQFSWNDGIREAVGNAPEPASSDFVYRRLPQNYRGPCKEDPRSKH